ncbi:SH3 domain-containing protein [Streptomyces nanshensis]|uniref:SH3 domain-containing protein n=1 Tax=Streptomyces nanshensis TaxID=518642 RepID=UPI00085C03F4|nr:SH3 domain-containing protein [Streptomyces nanshensis]
MKSCVGHRLAAAGAAGTLMIGGIVAGATAATAAPAGPAVGKSKCTSSPFTGTWETNARNVNLRNGPSTGYYSKGQLRKGTNVKYICSYIKGKRDWFYVKVKQGAHAGTHGWISGAYMQIAQ